jgi:CRISPR-associated protein Cas2
MNQFIVVVYDISNDRRRTKLHNALLDFGTPVQYSVFECWLTAHKIKRLKTRINKIIRPTKDHVRYYRLCANCVEKIEMTRAGELTKIQEVMVV